METPKGAGWARFVFDYGMEHHLVWVVTIDDTGEIWCVANPEVRLRLNWTYGRREKPMPLTAKGKKIKVAMQKEYGAKKGTSAFYASINKGKVKGAEKRRGRK